MAPQRTTAPPPRLDHYDDEDGGVVVGAENANAARTDGDGEDVGVGSDRGAEEERDAREQEEYDMEALLEAVERESGAEGKPAPEARRICCRFLLDAFRDGQFGTITLDSVPRRKKMENSPGQGGWAKGLVVAEREGDTIEARRPGGLGGDVGEAASGGGGGGSGGGAAAAEVCEKTGRQPLGSSPDGELAERLVRDWSSADAWERPAARRT